MDNEKYILTIADNDFKFQEELELDGYFYSLEKLSYDKGIYRPAEILVTMNVSGDGVKYGTLVDDFYMKDVKLTVNGNPVAENYFVFKVKPSFRTVSNASSVKLELTIYSQDKLMTLDKYSKAWTGKKLGVDIFTDEAETFKFNGDAIDTSCDLQVLNYSSGEFIQPFLVQYNESFYDFLKRTSNRCGEFLFHEKGKLHLGMEVNDVAKDDDPDYAVEAIERHYEDILREGVETSDYAYNYLKSQSSPADKPYSNPLTYDDYLDDVKKEYTDMDTQMDYLSRNIVGSVCMALEATSFSKIVGNLAAAWGFKALHANVAVANLNAVNMDKNINPWALISDQGGASSVRQFGTNSDQTPKNDFCGDTVNMNAKFFALVREAEKKVSENAVYLEFGESTKDLYIGDKIKVDGVYYIIIGVNGSCEVTYTTQKAKLMSQDDMLTPKFEEHQQVVAVKLYGDAAIPPALPDVIIRESQPQLAFVTQNFDPQKIGRVRVRFAWQPTDDKGSPWIRVALPFATNGAGVKFKPEVGDEVMVSFEEGNIERPYVSGFLLSPHNNDDWGNLPDRSITSKNGHNITFNDGLDGANFFYGASPGFQLIKSFIPTAKFPNAITDNAACLGLVGGMTLSDRYGLYKIGLSSDSRSVMIQSAVGTVTVNALTGISLAAPNGDIKIQGKNVSIEASDKVTIESGKALKDRFFPEDKFYQENNFTFLTGLGYTFANTIMDGLRAAGSRTWDKVIDVQLLRTVADVFLRPIDGTTKIQSHTFVQIEAGKGSAEIPRSARKENDGERVALDLYYTIDKISSTAKSRVEAIQSAVAKVCTGIQALKDISGENGINAKSAAIDFDTILSATNKEQASELQFKWDQVKLNEIPDEDKLADDYKKEIDDVQKNKPKADDSKYKGSDGASKYEEDMNAYKKSFDLTFSKYQNSLKARAEMIINQNKIKATANNLGTAIHDLFMAKKGFNAESDISSLFAKSFKSTLKGMEFSKEITVTQDMNPLTNNDWANLKRHHMRKAVSQFLSDSDVTKKVNNDFLKISVTGSTDDLQDKDNWNNLINASVSKPSKPLKNEIGLQPLEWAKDKYIDPAKSTINFKRWKVGTEGKILLSDDAETTMTFNKKGEIMTSENEAFSDISCEYMIRKLGSIGTNVE